MTKTRKSPKPRLSPKSQVASPLSFLHPNLELAIWAIAGLIIGIALGVTTIVAILITVLVIAAIARLYLEKTERSIRPSIGMVPVFIGCYGIGLFIKALIG